MSPLWASSSECAKMASRRVARTLWPTMLDIPQPALSRCASATAALPFSVKRAAKATDKWKASNSFTCATTSSGNASKRVLTTWSARRSATVGASLIRLLRASGRALHVDGHLECSRTLMLRCVDEYRSSEWHFMRNRLWAATVRLAYSCSAAKHLPLLPGPANNFPDVGAGTQRGRRSASRRGRVRRSAQRFRNDTGRCILFGGLASLVDLAIVRLGGRPQCADDQQRGAHVAVGHPRVSEKNMSSVVKFICRRLAVGCVTVWAISVIAFVIIQLPPGDFVTNYIAQLAAGGTSGSAADVAQLRAEYGLDQPMYVRYVDWAWAVLHGDFGRSLYWGRPVGAIIGDVLGDTLLLSFSGLVLSWVLAFPIAIYCAMRPCSAGDYLISTTVTIGLAIPTFLLALAALYVGFRYF